jgi:FixJ family two-component response regulator
MPKSPPFQLGKPFEVQAFESAFALLSTLSTGSVPECMIVDLQMPRMTALKLQRHLTQIGFRIPTILITAFDEPGVRERSVAAGAAADLLRPIGKKVRMDAIDMPTGSSM